MNNGGGAVDSYTVETSPETDTVRVTSGTTARLDLSYNERYVVSVTAVNCVGSSTPALTDPVEFGMLFLPKSSTLLAIVLFFYSWLPTTVQSQCDIRTLHQLSSRLYDLLPV